MVMIRRQYRQMRVGQRDIWLVSLETIRALLVLHVLMSSKEEHHISNFDPASFFTLHDYRSNGAWDAEDILRTYGLKDPSNAHISDNKRKEVVDTLLALYDQDSSSTITYGEFMRGTASGIKLPDFGLGPGHHGDDEYEYEIHHFEKYHGEDAKEEDLTHPEDIEHFRKHDELDAEMERIAQLDSMSIVEENIPAKFRRRG